MDERLFQNEVEKERCWRRRKRWDEMTNFKKGGSRRVIYRSRSTINLLSIYWMARRYFGTCAKAVISSPSGSPPQPHPPLLWALKPWGLNLLRLHWPPLQPPLLLCLDWHHRELLRLPRIPSIIWLEIVVTEESWVPWPSSNGLFLELWRKETYFMICCEGVNCLVAEQEKQEMLNGTRGTY